jgi:hypothetical protein
VGTAKKDLSLDRGFYASVGLQSEGETVRVALVPPFRFDLSTRLPSDARSDVGEAPLPATLSLFTTHMIEALVKGPAGQAVQVRASEWVTRVRFPASAYFCGCVCV